MPRPSLLQREETPLFACYREEEPSVIFTLLGATLSLPDRNDKASSLVGRDDTRIPNATQQSVQSQNVDAVPSKSFLISQLVHCPPSFLLSS